MDEKEIIYTLTLDHGKLSGRKNCEIRYVEHRGDMDSLCKDALTRNITLTWIPLRRYHYEKSKIERERLLLGVWRNSNG